MQSVLIEYKSCREISWQIKLNCFMKRIKKFLTKRTKYDRLIELFTAQKKRTLITEQ